MTGSAVVFDEYLRVLTVPPESVRRRKGLGKLRFGKAEEMRRSSLGLGLRFGNGWLQATFRVWFRFKLR